jgi:hypothetical protein
MLLERTIPAFAVAAAVALSGTQAEAVEIRVTVGGSSFTVADGDSDDLSGSANNVEYDMSDPSSGIAGDTIAGFNLLQIQASRCTVCPQTMTLTSQVTRTPNGGTDILGNTSGSWQPSTVVIEAWDWGFTLDDTLPWLGEADFAHLLANGTSVTSEAYWTDDNIPYNKEYKIGEFSAANNTASEIDTAFFANSITNSPYGMTLVFEFTADGQANTATLNADARLNAVPVPAALPLMGAALAGLGLMARRRRG